MEFAAVTIIIITSIVASLRYHALSQNNNYKLPLSSKLYFYFMLQLICYLISLATLLIFRIVYVAIPLGFSLIFNIILNVSFRTKFKFTKRGKSLFLSNNIIFIILVFLFLLYKNSTYRIIYAMALAVFYPLIITVSSNLVNSYYIKKNDLFVSKATDTLLNKNIVKIGITGSYGKTSCKNILKQMLMTKYKVYASKENYNTPMGIGLSINELTDEEIFIAEMGARKIGDIKELTQIVKPDYGIITGVTAQHLKTFGSLHNIYTEKFALAKALEEKGVCVFNGNDKYTLKMYKEHKGEKLKTCLNKYGDVRIDNIDMDTNGSKFSIEINDKLYFCHTVLLGRHNIINISMCVALAIQLGVNMDDIVEVIKNLQPVKHRLEYIFSNGIHILDDSYNSNILGIKSALECLSFFKERKVVLAQGIVELGNLQKSTNIEVGKMLSQVADILILTGSNKQYIKQGLSECGYKGKLFTFKSLKSAQQSFKHILQKNDVLLLQNDLPDVF